MKRVRSKADKRKRPKSAALQLTPIATLYPINGVDWAHKKTLRLSENKATESWQEKNCKSGTLQLTPIDSKTKGVDRAHMNRLGVDKVMQKWQTEVLNNLAHLNNLHHLIALQKTLIEFVWKEWVKLRRSKELRREKILYLAYFSLRQYRLKYA